MACVVCRVPKHASRTYAPSAGQARSAAVLALVLGLEQYVALQQGSIPSMSAAYLASGERARGRTKAAQCARVDAYLASSSVCARDV